MQHLQSAVKERYCSALTGGHLIFSQTHLTVIHSNGIPFQLRYCPALSQKPQSSVPSSSTTKPNPFLHPAAGLLVTQTPKDSPTHNIVLNKYPVIPNHFILSTTSFKPQNYLLEEDDLATTYSCLQEWEADPNSSSSSENSGLFAFFNSGQHSGASQPHRHIQFLSVEDMAGGEEGKSWSLLVDRILPGSAQDSATVGSHPDIPFVHFASRISPNPDPSDLHRLYMSLYERAVDAVRAHQESGEELDLETRQIEDGASAISYNLALTTSTMVICPRRSGCASLEVQQKDGKGMRGLGPIEMNGTILAGMLMVKTRDEWDELRTSDGEKLHSLLTAIGFPQKPTPARPDVTIRNSGGRL